MTAQGGSNGRSYAFVDSNNRIIEIADSNHYSKDELLTAPINSKYILCNNNTHSNKTRYLKRYINNDLSIIDEINSLKNEIKKEIKILCFGNSFTQDSMNYVPTILNTLCPELKLTLGVGFIGGCPLVQHLANFTGETQTLDSTQYNPINYSYYKSTNNGSWTTKSSNVDNMLTDEVWDIITFQQNGLAAYQSWETYFAPFIYKLINSLYSKLTYTVKLGWLLTQGAYFSDDESCLDHWQGTATNSRKVIEECGFNIIFPYGTALQNLRTTTLKTLGDGSAKNLTNDNAHLQEGIGCLVSAYSHCLTIMKAANVNIGLLGDKTEVSEGWLSSFNSIGTNLGTGVVGMTANNRYMAQIAANLAQTRPYELTDMTSIEGGLL